MKIKLNNILLDSRIITKYLTDSRRSILLASTTILLTTVIILSIIISPSSVSAESFQSNELLQFTFNPTISINISGSLIIEGLSPGDAKDSNIITVAIESNGIAGYNLYANTGNSSNNSNELRKDGVDTTNKFSSITTDKSSLSDFTDNTWGYSYSTDYGSTWTNYSSLPKYSDSNDKQLLSTTTPDTTNLQFKIAAKASTAQLAGEYTNVVNFIGITNPNPTYITLDEATYMQDSFSCTATKYGTVKSLIDKRDNQSYLVAKANDGNCWMIENLKIGKTLDSTTTPSITLDPTDSNVNDDFTLNYSDIPTDGKFHAYTIDDVPYQNNSNEWICRTDWDSCYYNWYTATAGSGSSYTASGNVNNSICSTGWTLPTGGSSGQFQALYDQYNSAALMLVDDPSITKNNFTGKIPGFLLSGDYSTGGAYDLGSYGGYWSRTAYTAQVAYDLLMNTDSVYPVNGYSKYYGFAVRCLHD